MRLILNSGIALQKLILASALAFALNPALAQTVNEDAAVALAKAGNCFRCHSVDKAKKAPSYKRIATKYKGNPAAEAKLMKHLSGAQTVKVEDGGDEEHEPPPTKDVGEVKNLVRWILSRE